MTYFKDREVRSRGDMRAERNVYVYSDGSTAYKVPTQQATNQQLIQSGNISIATGTASGTSTFDAAFTSIPIVVFAQNNSTGQGNITQVLSHTVTTTSFNISANADAVGTANYKYIAIGDM